MWYFKFNHAVYFLIRFTKFAFSAISYPMKAVLDWAIYFTLSHFISSETEFNILYVTWSSSQSFVNTSLSNKAIAPNKALGSYLR